VNEEIGQISVEEQANNVDSHTNQRHARAWFEEFPNGRWNGTIPKITSSRARAIADKRAYEKFIKTVRTDQIMTGAQFVEGAMGGNLCGVVDWYELSAGLSLEIKRELRQDHRRLVVLLSAAAKLGYVAVWLAWPEIAKVLDASESTARRRFRELVELKLVQFLSPMFEKFNRVSSQRGNAWAVSAFIAEGAALRARDRGGLSPTPQPKEQPSRRDVRIESETPRLGQPLGSASDNGARDRDLSMAGQALRAEVEPEYFSAAVPGGATDAAGRSTRQAESTSSSPEAGQAVSDEEKSWWLAASLASIGGAS